MLAAKTALAIRYDAFGEGDGAELGLESRARLELRLRHLEENSLRRISGSGKSLAKFDKYQHKSEVRTYDPSGETIIPLLPKKRKLSEMGESPGKPITKKIKKEPMVESDGELQAPKKKKKKQKVKDEEEKVEVKVKEEEGEEEEENYEASTSIMVRMSNDW
uniref:Nop domain-containing protein n=1 Tax=Eptatretus burgeri TaxID=7764 RepID=A0A8C4X1K0_EPTBU